MRHIGTRVLGGAETSYLGPDQDEELTFQDVEERTSLKLSCF